MGCQFRNKHVYPHFKDKGFSVITLQGGDAIRTKVINELQKNGIVCITGVGHGESDVYTGDNLSILFKVKLYNKKEVKGKIIHLLSCVVAAKLGPDFVKKGCRAFFGYENPFSFDVEFKDIFFRCDSEIDLALADGNTTTEVYQRASNIYTDAIEKLNDSGQFYIAGMLQRDLNILRSPAYGSMYGSQTAKL